MTQGYHNAQTTVIFVFRIQDKCWNRSEFGVHIKWVELNWNDGGKLCEQSCCCVLNLKGWRNWNIFQLGFRNTECKWWRLGASDSIGYEVGSVALTGNYRSWRSVRNSSSLTFDPHWSEVWRVNGLKIASTSVYYIKIPYFMYSRDRLKKQLHSELVLFLYWIAHVEFPISVLSYPESFSENFVSEM